MESTTFLLRDVPGQLHREWAEASRSRDMSMRTYALLALTNQVARDHKRKEQRQLELEGGELDGQ